MHSANSSADSIRVPNRRPISWRGQPARVPVRWCAALLALLATVAVRAATVTWTGGSGDWSAPANWSSGALPGTNDDVVIGPGPAITVTHSSGSDAVSSIQSQQAFVLSGGSLAVSASFQANGGLTLSGGTLQNATVVATNAAPLVVNGSGTLDEVTVNGVLDVGNTYTANLTVTNGLVLNGTALVGNRTNSNYGGIQFAGSQTLSGSGTVIFGNWYGGYENQNALYLGSGGTTLTVGPGITVRGEIGMIGAAAYPWDRPTNVALINRGTISADVSGGRITVNAQPFSNEGSAQGTNGGVLTLNGSTSNTGTLSVAAGSGLNFGGSWTNAGTFNSTNAAIGLGGTFILSDLGSFNALGDKVYLTGTLSN
ncbi:MAG TPA: hypothetical protein VN829_06440, partial [Dongiaceae bacterium]|nr:hypothetical protein [Dongiaceae bacterium]